MTRTWAIALLLVLVGGRGALAATSDRLIQVLTIGPGDHLFTCFGHIALVTVDRRTAIRKVYNFGEFNVRDPQLRFRYVKGELQYWLALTSFESMIDHYRGTERAVQLRTLNLTSRQVDGLIRLLDRAALPQNRTYRYQHFTNNCCTKVRDALNEVLDGALMARDHPGCHTYRRLIRPALDRFALQQLALDLLLGPSVDRSLTHWQEQFLPAVFSETLDEIRLAPDNRPLVIAKERLGGMGQTGTGGPWQWGLRTAALFFFLLLLSPVMARDNPNVARVFGLALAGYGLLCGLAGGALLAAWTLTEHQDMYGNMNILVFPFFHLWLIYPGVRLLISGRCVARLASRTRQYLVCALILCGFVLILKWGPLYQDNGGFIAFAVLCNAAALFSLAKARLGQEEESGRGTEA